jgi:hypothetical protein
MDYLHEDYAEWQWGQRKSDVAIWLTASEAMTGAVEMRMGKQPPAILVILSAAKDLAGG